MFSVFTLQRVHGITARGNMHLWTLFIKISTKNETFCSVFESYIVYGQVTYIRLNGGDTMNYRKRTRNLYKGSNFIADNLRILRILNNMTQEDVANELGCSRSAYAKLESGLKFANFPILYKLSLFYNVDLDYLVYFNITAHLLSLIQRTSISIDPLDFAESYSKLSEAAKSDINKRMQAILEHEKEFNVF